MHHLRVDDATRISLIRVAPRIRFHEENFAWDGDNSGACYSTYIACARCWTKSITTSPGTILFRNMAILYMRAFSEEERLSLSPSTSDCTTWTLKLELVYNLFYKFKFIGWKFRIERLRSLISSVEFAVTLRYHLDRCSFVSRFTSSLQACESVEWHTIELLDSFVRN